MHPARVAPVVGPRSPARDRVARVPQLARAAPVFVVERAARGCAVDVQDEGAGQVTTTSQARTERQRDRIDVGLAACGTLQATSTTPTTQAHIDVLIGRVTAGPTCPVERIGHPCPPRPLIGNEVQARAGTRVVASTHTTAGGTYRLQLAAGSWAIVTLASSMLPRCPTHTVNVTAGLVTCADIDCDTGIQ